MSAYLTHLLTNISYQQSELLSVGVAMSVMQVPHSCCLLPLLWRHPCPGDALCALTIVGAGMTCGD
eukprot:4590777-Pyramimonas_sp.AAC.1